MIILIIFLFARLVEIRLHFSFSEMWKKNYQLNVWMNIGLHVIIIHYFVQLISWGLNWEISSYWIRHFRSILHIRKIMKIIIWIEMDFFQWLQCWSLYTYSSVNKSVSSFTRKWVNFGNTATNFVVSNFRDDEDRSSDFKFANFFDSATNPCSKFSSSGAAVSCSDSSSICLHTRSSRFCSNWIGEWRSRWILSVSKCGKNPAYRVAC